MGRADVGEWAGSGVRVLQAGLLDVAGGHSCAVLDDGSAGCWGFDGINGFGRLGDDAVIADMFDHPELVATEIL